MVGRCIGSKFLKNYNRVGSLNPAEKTGFPFINSWLCCLVSKVDCIGNCARLMHFILQSLKPKIFFSNQIPRHFQMEGDFLFEFQDDTLWRRSVLARPSFFYSFLAGLVDSRAFKRIIWKDKCIHSSCDPYMDFELENTLLRLVVPQDDTPKMVLKTPTSVHWRQHTCPSGTKAWKILKITDS